MATDPSQFQFVQSPNYGGPLVDFGVLSGRSQTQPQPQQQQQNSAQTLGQALAALVRGNSSSSQPTVTQSPLPNVPAAYAPMISTAAQYYGVDPAVITRQIQQESSFDPRATSPAGAKGISQFMPGTAARYGVDVTDPRSSILGQAHYMSDLSKQFGGNTGLALAGYNWGEGNVHRWLAGGPAPPKETRDYVMKITGRTIEDWRKQNAGQ